MPKRNPPNRKADRPIRQPRSPGEVEVRSNDAGARNTSDTLKPVRPTPPPAPKQGDRRNDK